MNSSAGFPTTHWTLVNAIQAGDPDAAPRAMDELCRSYWYPIYAFLRRSSHTSHEAEDLTQDFFHRLITEDAMQNARQSAGRLRSWLLAVLKRLVSDHLRHQGAQKRGGGRTFVSFDQMNAEERYSSEPQDHRDPESLFTRAWAHQLLDSVREKLRGACDSTGRAGVFDLLLPFLVTDDEPPSHREIAQKLGSSVAASRILIFRLRAKFRDLLRDEVALTVLAPEEIPGELNWLQGVLLRNDHTGGYHPMIEPTPGADNYQIGRAVARGGMGSILEAEDTKLHRTVAIKTMHFDASADERMRRRFLREAEVLAMLAHPNIVPIYDIVWEDGVPLFYSMKLLNGRTLQAILNDLRHGEPQSREFTLPRLLHIFRKVCDAIAFAHSKGVLHRDLKPENVMVGEFGEVMVMDWGLATGKYEGGSVEDEALEPEDLTLHTSCFNLTLAGSVLGTPQYMSPEQAMGLSDELDERSDIFSLGGILYAILTFRPPVEGGTRRK